MGVRSTLDEILAGETKNKVHVTLTYAQSLDGRIAGKNGLQLRLSGEESMLLTHWMRTRHDAILVGIGTALNDNPQLNGKFLSSLSPNNVRIFSARLLPPRPDGQSHPLPRPTILDSDLRLRPGCKLLANFSEKKGLQPWVFCKDNNEPQFQARREALEKAGARILTLPVLESGKNFLPT
jgi:2,5-diamino-6-(ribosylamino)-4(3H)-pyrimidinone 5'-phosphate reductase